MPTSSSAISCSAIWRSSTLMYRIAATTSRSRSTTRCSANWPNWWKSEARAHVAKLLAPLERAPGNVVVKLANDSIEVARPLLEFSNVLSDDDLIEIIANQTEEHRIAIAGRPTVPERVGDAIVEHRRDVLGGPAGPQPQGRTWPRCDQQAGRARHQRCRDRSGPAWPRRYRLEEPRRPDQPGRRQGARDDDGARSACRSRHRRQGVGGRLQPHAQPCRLLGPGLEGRLQSGQGAGRSQAARTRRR